MESVSLYGTGKFVVYVPKVCHPKKWRTFFEKRVEDSGMHVEDVKEYDRIDCSDDDFYIIEFTAQISTSAFMTSKEIRACLKDKYDCIEGILDFRFDILGFIFMKEFVADCLEYGDRNPYTQSRLQVAIHAHMSDSKTKGKMKKKATKFFLIFGAYRYKDELQRGE